VLILPGRPVVCRVAVAVMVQVTSLSSGGGPGTGAGGRDRGVAGCGQQLGGVLGVGVVDEDFVAVGAQPADGSEVAATAGERVCGQSEQGAADGADDGPVDGDQQRGDQRVAEDPAEQRAQYGAADGVEAGGAQQASQPVVLRVYVRISRR
jgi:hypothetical protein